MEETIVIGTLQKPFGIKGEIRGKSLTSFMSERFKKGNHYILKNPKDGDSVEVTLSSFRPSDNYFFVGFEGIDNPEKALSYYGYEIRIPLKDAPLPNGYYRLADLIGMSIIDTDTSKKIGEIKDVVPMGNVNNIKAISSNGKHFNFPFIYGSFVEKIDVEKKEFYIHVIEGLL